MKELENCGIGSRTIDKLNNLGVTTVKELALTHSYKLVDAGIGNTTVTKILKSARKTYMDIHGFDNHDAERFVLKGVTLQDATILAKIQKQLSCLYGSYYSVRAFRSFDTHLDYYIDENTDKEDFGIGEYTDKEDKIYKNRVDFWYSFGCMFYKLEKGRVILLWYHPYYINAGPFPILKKIPKDLLELSHLKYSCILCTNRAIERMPETIRSNDIFEVRIEPSETSASYLVQEIKEVGSELKIIRRGALDGYDNELEFLLDEAFIRRDL